MEFFKQWCFCICITLIISVVFSIFSPKGEMNRFYKIMLSLFVFISFLYPLKEFDAAEFQTDKYSSIFEINDNSDAIYENEINRSIKAFLSEKGITGVNVSSKVKFSLESSEIEIKDVLISIPDEYDKEEVKKLVFDEIGLNSRVVYVGQ